MKTSLWQLGFRPFFLLGSLHALISILLWIAYLSGILSNIGSMNPYLWHPHEMIFGFSSAIVAGFVLTAIQNWSGKRGVHGLRLQFLVVVWIAARILIAVPTAPRPLVAALDLVFYPWVAWLLVPYLKDPELKTERVFFIFFGVLFAGNLLVHLEAMEMLIGYSRQGLYLGLYTIVLIVIFIGGRVIPFFTESSIARKQPRTWVWVEISSHVSAALFAVLAVFYPSTAILGAVALLTAAIHGVRLLGWQVRRVRRVPLIWVLHSAYFWLILGFVLTGLSSWGAVAISAATHAFTVGGIGVVIYGMISRVSLGHTGRRLHPSAAIVVGYVLLNLAAVLRVFTQLRVTSGLLWIGAFTLFIVIYTPILTRPRVDGRPG